MSMDRDFALSVLKGLGIPENENAIAFLLRWAKYEGGSAKNNPLNTTWDMRKADPGQTDYNSAHVKNYSTRQIGIAATVNTLKLSYYSAIRKFLISGENSLNFKSNSLADSIRTWGTTNFATNFRLRPTDPPTPKPTVTVDPKKKRLT